MAADYIEQVGRAAGRIEASWSPERAAQILRGVHVRKRRQRQRRALGAVAALLVLAVLSPRLVSSLRAVRGNAGIASLSGQSKGPLLAGAELPLSAPPLHLRDGSVARPQGKASQVRLREERPGRTVLELAGSAQFEVVHDPRRLFRVETPGLAVEVLGTRFAVEEQGPRVRVTVQQGRVRVLWASHYEELGAGQSGVFQPEPPAGAGPASAPGAALPPLREPAPAAVSPELTAAVASSRLPSAVATQQLPLEVATPQLSPAVATPQRLRTHHSSAQVERSAKAAVPAPVITVAAEVTPTEVEPASWQTLAHEGQFEQAYRVAYGAPAAAAHHAPEPPLLRERAVAPGELLLLADVARLSHHPADAMAPLSRLLREHAADPRAPLAAFTLGRVLLDDLGRPREAAQSFLRVQQLDPDGPLSQDALAREVEAWSRAGEAASARARALQYVQKYPAGRRLRSVRHFGELL